MNFERTQRFIESKAQQRITFVFDFGLFIILTTNFSNFVNNCLKIYAPGCAKRFQRCADFHSKKYGIRPPFGLYWNLCINAPFHGQRKRVHLKWHADRKNIAGGHCGVFVTCGKSSSFFLLIWDRIH